MEDSCLPEDLDDFGAATGELLGFNTLERSAPKQDGSETARSFNVHDSSSAESKTFEIRNKLASKLAHKGPHTHTSARAGQTYAHPILP